MAEEDIDPAALQAQIDISNALTHELVSSWIKPRNDRTTNTIPQLTWAEVQRELDGYARRPPRYVCVG